MREARIHIRRLRDLLSTSLYQSGFTATDNMSLSLYSTVAGIDPEGKILPPDKLCSLVIMSLIDYQQKYIFILVFISLHQTMSLDYLFYKDIHECKTENQQITASATFLCCWSFKC